MQTKLFGWLDAAKLGLPLFTIALGLLDGFNPCAMWVLIFLLATLAGQGNRARMAVTAITFVVVSGLMYFAFMAAWLGVVPAALVGGVGAIAVVFVWMRLFPEIARIDKLTSEEERK